MGGNIFKNSGGERKSYHDYMVIKKDVEITLYGLFSDGLIKEWFIPIEREDKQDFGDIDILISCENWDKALKYFNVEKFANTGGNVFSYLHPAGLQIDLIFTHPNNFEIYKNFISYGDASMIIGRISRLFDLKYGIYGLEFIIRDEDTNHVISEINISKDPKRILEFLGYDWARWEKGFPIEGELFEYVFSSKYIFKDILKEYSENTKHRKRDKHREQYKRMYDWFMERQHLFPDNSPIKGLGIEKRLEIVQQSFPESDIVNKYKELISYVKDIKDAREKFSGKHIREMFPDISDKDFGNIMSKWNGRFENQKERVYFVLTNSVEDLKQELLKTINA